MNDNRKKDLLMDAVGEIDDKVIDSALTYSARMKKKRVFLRSAVSIAAALAIVVTAIPAAIHLIGNEKSKANDKYYQYGQNVNGNASSGNQMYPSYDASGGGYKDSVNNFDSSIIVAPGGLQEGSIDVNWGNESIAGDAVPSVKENPFIETSKENEETNISTFSADVDTASYCYFRRLVTGGRYTLQEIKNISAGAIRTEEWINYFDYSYNEAKEGSLFGVKTDIIKTPWSSTFLFRTSLKATGDIERSDNNLVFLIDVSGSMSSEYKLPLLKKAFSHLVEKLDASDTVSIVTYSGSEAVVLDGCRGDKHELIMNAVESLKAGGSTNGEAGLTMAYTLVEKYMKEGGNNRIIMATDGDLNVGISDPDALKKYISEKKEIGAYISVLGFGASPNGDSRMEAIADNGNGVYYIVDSEIEAERIFGDKLTSTLYTVANDLKLQVKFNPELVSGYRLIGYENRMLATEDFDDDTKDAADVGAEQCVTAVYEITLVKTPSAEDEEYASLSIRYKPFGVMTSTLEEYKVGIESVKEADDEMLFIASVIGTSMLIRDSEYKADLTPESLLEIINSIELTDKYMNDFKGYVNAIMKN